MRFNGVIDEIIFRNVENGYSIVVLDCQGVPITAVGTFPLLGEGEALEVDGEWKNNPRFGHQLAVTSVRVIPPTSKQAVTRYLAGGLFKGVGEATAAAIVDKFGDKALEVIDAEPARLASVKGVSLKKAMALSDTLHGLRDMQDTILFLQNYEVSLNLACKIYKVYGSGTRRIVSDNPYKLVDDVDGVGFLTADKIAVKLGIARDSRFRISACITYVLRDAMSKNGHTYMPLELLVKETLKLLALPDIEETVRDCVGDNVVMGRIVTLTAGGEDSVMLTRSFQTERSIARKLCSLMSKSAPLAVDADADIAAFEKACNITLHSSQRDAVKNCVSYGAGVITGGPGTGKTTITRCIIDMIKNAGKSVCLCAPTGRAAKRLSEATGEDAKTIHRLLDLDFTDGKGYFTYNENFRLEQDVIIVDEVSMCDEYVFNALVTSVKDGGRLIMLGDKDQLPSVGAGNVLADIISCDCVPVSYLTQIFRQDESSRIIFNAHKINAGVMPVLDNRSSDFFFDNRSDPSDMLKVAVEMATRRVPKFLGVDVRGIQILCPMKKGVAGVYGMNEAMQEALNPSAAGKGELRVGDAVLREGDKVIHNVNNYQMQWTNCSEGTSGEGVFNGDIGYIVAANAAEPSLTVEFEDGRRAKYVQGEFDQLSLAYAVSIHKSQGSEFDVVIIAVTSGNYLIMTRNLLYTAVTRAKRMVVLIGERENIAKMVSNNYTARRYTNLAEFIRQEFTKRY